jgi:hypothetical protein
LIADRDPYDIDMARIKRLLIFMVHLLNAYLLP